MKINVYMTVSALLERRRRIFCDLCYAMRDFLTIFPFKTAHNVFTVRVVPEKFQDFLHTEIFLYVELISEFFCTYRKKIYMCVHEKKHC